MKDRVHLALLPLVVSAALCGLVTPAAFAQGGPPMVTDDPETPGDGKWEINLAGLGARTRVRKDVSLPDADINYGLGDRIQLKVDVPWSFAKESGSDWKSGVGTGNVGVKWRFVDGGEEGISISTYPQYLSSWSASSRRRGITSDERELFLPIEVAGKMGEWAWDGEVGRAIVRNGDNQWVAGGILAHDCGAHGECLFEVHETVADRVTQSLVNLGLRWKLSDRATLLGSIGREFGPRTEDRQDLVFYLGVQLLN